MKRQEEQGVQWVVAEKSQRQTDLSRPMRAEKGDRVSQKGEERPPGTRGGGQRGRERWVVSSTFKSKLRAP